MTTSNWLVYSRKQLPEISLAGSQAPAWEPYFLQAPAWPFFGKQELQKTHSQAGALEQANHL